MIRNWFDKKQGNAGASIAGFTGPRIPRYSGAWATLRKRLQAETGLRVIDIGYTSPTNINYLTSLGHSVFMADIVADACKGDWKRGADPEGNPTWDIPAFLDSTFSFGGRMFDIVLLWTALDYLPEPFVVPVVAHLHSFMNTGGSVLSFFHTKTQGEGTGYSRFHLRRAITSTCSRENRFRFSAHSPTEASSVYFPGGPATGSFLPKTPSPKSS